LLSNGSVESSKGFQTQYEEKIEIICGSKKIGAKETDAKETDTKDQQRNKEWLL
jgi:hypothetical protein